MLATCRPTSGFKTLCFAKEGTIKSLKFGVSWVRRESRSAGGDVSVRQCNAGVRE